MVSTKDFDHLLLPLAKFELQNTQEVKPELYKKWIEQTGCPHLAKQISNRLLPKKEKKFDH